MPVPEVLRRRTARLVSTRTVIIAHLVGQWHPLNIGWSDDTGCPNCGAASRLFVATAKGWANCNACGCVINVETGEAYVSADDEPPPGTDTGARGERVPVWDQPFAARPPRLKHG